MMRGMVLSRMVTMAYLCFVIHPVSSFSHDVLGCSRWSTFVRYYRDCCPLRRHLPACSYSPAGRSLYTTSDCLTICCVLLEGVSILCSAMFQCWGRSFREWLVSINTLTIWVADRSLPSFSAYLAVKLLMWVPSACRSVFQNAWTHGAGLLVKSNAVFTAAVPLAAARHCLSYSSASSLCTRQTRTQVYRSI